MKKILRCAFSLVELMVTLIILSCIISAMTPIITKKLQSQGITVGSGGGGNSNFEFEQDCSSFGEDCALCFSDRCAMCTKECLASEYVEISSCTCKTCDIFNFCKECSSKQCKKCENGYFLNDVVCEVCPVGYFCDGEIKQECDDGYYQNEAQKATCKTCESKDENCSLCDKESGECITCKERYGLVDGVCKKLTKIPSSQTDCTPFDAIYIPAKYNGSDNLDLCVTRKDIGETGGPPIYEGPNTKVVSLGSYCDNAYGYCCWLGNPVTCGFYAARESCQNWTINNSEVGTWDLPTKNIADGWASSYSSSSEFQYLFYTQLDLPRNMGWTNNCPGASGGDYNSGCYYHVMWTTYFENSNAYTIHCNSTPGTMIWGNATASLVARCVAHELPNIE